MNFLESFKQVHTLIFDVDGVLTNGEVIILENGRLLRKMNIRDGYAIKKAIRSGLRVVVITGGKSSGVIERMKGLGVKDIYSGIDDKLEVYRELVELYDLDSEGILYMGDDLPDYDVMRRVGLPTCPKDAAREIKELCRYISPFEGGRGCVRDVIEKVLQLQQKWLDE